MVNVALAYAFITVMFCLRNRVGIDAKDGGGGGGRAWCGPGAVSEELGRVKLPALVDLPLEQAQLWGVLEDWRVPPRSM